MAATGGPFQGLTDLMISRLPRGSELDALVGAKQAQIARGATATRVAVDDASSVAVPWAKLQCRHPVWDLRFWEECRGLYAGGKRLLCNDDLLKRLFLQNAYENGKVYEARKARAHYFPYPGTIIDSLIAGLSSDPLRIAFGKVNQDTGDLEPVDNTEWWQDFVEDVSNEAYSGAVDADEQGDSDDEEGGEPMHHFLVEIVRECMQTQLTWVRCDLPPPPDDATSVDSKLAEERAGVNDPYLCRVPAENVIDWEYDSRGKVLQWVLTLEKSQPRASILQTRGKMIHYHFELWTQTDMACFDVDIDPASPPPDDAVIAASGGGPHEFGRVPFECVMLPEGLWAMAKMHSLAREHLNKRCAMSWAEYKALFSILYEYLDDETGGSDLPEVGAPDRATSQTRAQGFTQLRRKGDKAEFVGPDVGPFKEARESCNDIMREMHRVMFSMALSANMDKAALSRSGDSKEKDEATTKVLLAALGLIVRRTARRLLALASCGRHEAVPQAQISGLEHFDISGVSNAISDAVALYSGGVPIHSKTFNTLYLVSLYRKILGDSATDAQIATIREEIEEGISNEEIQAQAMQEQLLKAGTTEDDPDDENEDDSDETDDKPPPEPDKPPPRPIRSKPMKK